MKKGFLRFCVRSEEPTDGNETRNYRERFSELTGTKTELSGTFSELTGTPLLKILISVDTMQGEKKTYLDSTKSLQSLFGERVLKTSPQRRPEKEKLMNP